MRQRKRTTTHQYSSPSQGAGSRCPANASVVRLAKPVFIYALLDRPTKTCYIGSTWNIKNRMAGHFTAPRTITKPNVSSLGISTKKGKWIEAMRLAGRKPEVVILETTNAKNAPNAERNAMRRAEAAGWTLKNGSPSTVVMSRV